MGSATQPTSKAYLPRRCPGRCWFAYYGWVGSSSPKCVRCGRANPNYRPDDDPFPKGPR